MRYAWHATRCPQPMRSTWSAASSRMSLAKPVHCATELGRSVLHEVELSPCVVPGTGFHITLNRLVKERRTHVLFANILGERRTLGWERTALQSPIILSNFDENHAFMVMSRQALSNDILFSQNSQLNAKL